MRFLCYERRVNDYIVAPLAHTYQPCSACTWIIVHKHEILSELLSLTNCQGLHNFIAVSFRIQFAFYSNKINSSNQVNFSSFTVIVPPCCRWTSLGFRSPIVWPGTRQSSSIWIGMKTKTRLIRKKQTRSLNFSPVNICVSSPTSISISWILHVVERYS